MYDDQEEQEKREERQRQEAEEDKATLARRAAALQATVYGEPADEWRHRRAWKRPFLDRARYRVLSESQVERIPGLPPQGDLPHASHAQRLDARERRVRSATPDSSQ